MKAILHTKYGPPEVLNMMEVENPSPMNNEVLVRVHEVVGIQDSMHRKGKPYFGIIFVGLTKPRKPILGTELTGEIETVGKNIKIFKKNQNSRFNN